MAGQLDLFEEAEKRAKAGMEASAENSGERWVEYATGFVRWFLERNPTLHVDALWDSGLQVPRSPRGLGKVMQDAVKNGWMERITTPEGYAACKPSVRSNGQMKQVWKSRLYQGG